MNIKHGFQGFFQNLYNGIKAHRSKNASESEGPTFDALSLGIMFLSLALLMMDNTRAYSEAFAWTFFTLSCIFMASIVIPKTGKILSSILKKGELFTKSIFPFLLLLFSLSIVNDWLDSMDNIEPSVMKAIGIVVTAWFVVFLLIVTCRVYVLVAVCWIAIYLIYGSVSLITHDYEGAITLFILAVLSTALITGLTKLHDDLRL